MDKELPEIERYINANSSHIYNIKDNQSLSAFLNLLQHHGYPTPLLDWTHSPFVAAYFAFEKASRLNEVKDVTIFVFNKFEWDGDFVNTASLRSPGLQIASLELPVYGNPRVIPQQSIIMFSNIKNIESYIIASEERLNKSYLTAISIPYSEREKALKDLDMMGITKGSLFPGLDGLCQQLKTKHFG